MLAAETVAEAAVSKKTFKSYLTENTRKFYYLGWKPVDDKDEEKSDFKRDEVKKAYDKEIEKNDKEKGDGSINKSKLTDYLRIVNAASE
jgi:hypothetical protein